MFVTDRVTDRQHDYSRVQEECRLINIQKISAMLNPRHFT